MPLTVWYSMRYLRVRQGCSLVVEVDKLIEDAVDAKYREAVVGVGFARRTDGKGFVWVAGEKVAAGEKLRLGWERNGKGAWLVSGETGERSGESEARQGGDRINGWSKRGRRGTSSTSIIIIIIIFSLLLHPLRRAK
jgi:hypothetical protein